MLYIITTCKYFQRLALHYHRELLLKWQGHLTLVQAALWTTSSYRILCPQQRMYGTYSENYQVRSGRTAAPSELQSWGDRLLFLKQVIGWLIGRSSVHSQLRCCEREGMYCQAPQNCFHQRKKKNPLEPHILPFLTETSAPL